MHIQKGKLWCWMCWKEGRSHADFLKCRGEYNKFNTFGTGFFFRQADACRAVVVGDDVEAMWSEKTKILWPVTELNSTHAFTWFL